MSLKKTPQTKKQIKTKTQTQNLTCWLKTGSFEFPRGRIASCETVYVKQRGLKKKQKTNNKPTTFFLILC